MKRFIFFGTLFLFSFSILFSLKRIHLNNFFRGKRELKELLEGNTFQKKGPDEFMGFIYIAHAGGGLNGKSYLNNLEAINHSYDLGVNFIEIDFNYTSDSVVVLSHDYSKLPSNEFLSDKMDGTHMTLEDLMEWLKNREIKIITDIKSDNIKTLQKIIKKYPELSKKIIPQAYTIPEIGLIRKLGFENVIFTNYISLYPNIIIKKLASAEILFGITLPYDINFRILDYFNDFRKMQTSILTHTLNDLSIANRLKESGCKGIYTDFLLFTSKE